MKHCLINLSLLALLVVSCQKDEPNCPFLPAGSGLAFRIVDTAGNDLVYGNSDLPVVSQPCRTDSLVTFYKNYRIPDRTDSGTVISFGNLNTPEPGSGADCYRIYFNWQNDLDTIDWHYRLESNGDCLVQIIDYMSFNGIQAKKKSDFAVEYYELVKQ